MKKKLTGVLIATLVLVETSLAAPTVVFEDDFNDEPVVGFNVVPEAWILGVGAVDIIGEGTPLDFFPAQGYGLYLDLDGGVGAVLATKDAILFQMGYTYTLTFDLAGNQQPEGPNETVAVGLLDQGPAFEKKFLPQWNQGFSEETVEIPGDGLPHQIVFYNMYSYDNKGALLDNVVLTEECDDPCPVPAPGAVLLGSLGAALVGFFRRRSL